MFICDECGESSKKRVKPIRKIVETRKTKYPKRYITDYKTMKDICIDNGGSGWEIVKEIKTCGCSSVR